MSAQAASEPVLRLPLGPPAFEAIFRKLERIAVCLDCVVQKLLLRIGVAHFKVVDGDLGVQT